jgi:hypothetical protein
MDDNMIGDCDLYVGNENPLNKPLIKVYPNPAVDQLYIDIKEIDGGDVYFQLFDLLGREINTQVISEKFSTISLKALTPGMYIYSILKGPKKVKTGKLNIINY